MTTWWKNAVFKSEHCYCYRREASLKTEGKEAHLTIQGSDTWVITKKTQRVFFGRKPIEKPNKKPAPNLIRLHHYHGEDYCFCQYYYFFSSQTKFSGQTQNLYRYGPQVDLRTLTHFQ